jgi:hypothetical protein
MFLHIDDILSVRRVLSYRSVGSVQRGVDFGVAVFSQCVTIAKFALVSSGGDNIAWIALSCFVSAAYSQRERTLVLI